MIKQEKVKLIQWPRWHYRLITTKIKENKRGKPDIPKYIFLATEESCPEFQNFYFPATFFITNF